MHIVLVCVTESRIGTVRYALGPTKQSSVLCNIAEPDSAAIRVMNRWVGARIKKVPSKGAVELRVNGGAARYISGTWL
jgi:hypothetical protein